MPIPDLSGKRVLLLGAGTDLGDEIARALADAGAFLALVAASNDPQTAFAVQRLARKLGAHVSQAIDAMNEMAVRVMVRQVSKELGGLDAVVSCPELEDFEHQRDAKSLARKFAHRELEREGSGAFVEVVSPHWHKIANLTQGEVAAPEPRVASYTIERHAPGLIGAREKSIVEISAEVLAALAAPRPSG